MIITVNVTFYGGNGTLDLKIMNGAGDTIDRKRFNPAHGTERLDLVKDDYVFNCTGTAAGGAEIMISHPSSPPTPFSFSPGPVFKNFEVYV